MRTLILLAGLVTALTLWLAGCGGSSSNSVLHTADNTAGVGAPGTVQLMLADAPFDGVSEVNVTITRVDLLFDGVEDSQQVGTPDDDGTNETTEPEENGGPSTGQTMIRNGGNLHQHDHQAEDSDDIWVTVFTGNTTVNLLDLANQPLNNLLQLTSTSAPSGHYKQIRLTISDGSTVVLSDNSIKALRVPSHMLRAFINLTVAPDTTAQVLLDFDLSAPGSLRAMPDGSYLLTPRLRTCRLEDKGTILGHLALPTGFALANTPLIATLSLTDGNARAYATLVIFRGTTTGTTRPFALHGVPAGTYTVNAAGTWGTHTFSFTVPNVTVTAHQPTDLGTVTIPAF